MRKFAFSYPMLLLAIWTGVLLAGDYVVLDTSARQILARRYATTTGEIMRSELGRGALGSRGLDIGYSYTVNGMDYTGRRYRYDDRNGAFDYRAATNALRPGSRQTVYYDSANPADSVLAPGLNGCDLLLVVFAIPLNVVSFAVWSGVIRSRRNRSRLAHAGGVRILRHEGETRVRLAEFSPTAAGFFGLAVAAFAASMLVVFAAGFAPSVRLMSAVLVLVAAAGMAAFTWTGQNYYLGHHDLRLHDASQTLLVPPVGRRKQALLVPRAEIVAVSMWRRVNHTPSGQYFSYVTALNRAVPGAQPQSLELVNWGWTEEKARALAGWFSQELGVPFKGVEEAAAGSPSANR